MIQEKRSGAIDFLKFGFSVMVVMFHGWKTLLGERPLSFFPFMQGRIACEFFFIVSGFLMAAHIAKKNQADSGKISISDLGRETAGFVWKKYLSVAVYLVIILLVTFALYWYLNRWSAANAAKMFLNMLPNFFCIHEMYPTPYEINDVIWYISAMLIVMIPLYPIGRRTGSFLNCVIAPFLALFSYGSIYAHGNLLYAPDIVYFGCIGLRELRALGGICLGCVAYEIAGIIRKKQLTSSAQWLISIGEWLIYAITVIYACVDFPSAGYSIALLLMFAVAVTFSGRSRISEKFRSRLFNYLGKISLPLFLAQRLVIECLGKLPVSVKTRFVILPFAAVIVGVILERAVFLVKSSIKKTAH